MSGPILMGPFKMPMMRDFVPKKVQPWLYVFIAAVFQLTGVVYLGSMGQMVGTTPLTQEDIMMIVFFGIVGVNMPFPFLFRFKFHFTNKQLLATHATIILICNFIAMYTTFMPLLCVMSYMAGFSKLCGTFECMSNIQLWMTPKRDFTIFFPFLYIIVLGDIQMSSYVAAYINFLYDWQAMNWLVIGLLCMVILIIVTCTKQFRFMKPLPLYSMDWLGCLLWSALLLEIVYIFNYGEYYNWFDSNNICVVTLALVPTGYFCIGRMIHIRHAYIERAAWNYHHLFTLLGLFLVTEILAAAPDVLQSIVIRNVLHYDSLHTADLYLFGVLGILLGSWFTWQWTHKWKLSYVRLIAIGYMGILAYHITMYTIIMPGINIEQFYAPTIAKMFGETIIFCALTIYLEEIMPFQHFFMGLTIIGMIRTGVGQAVGSAIYSFGTRYFIADNTAHYAGTISCVRAGLLEQKHQANLPQIISNFMLQMQMVSVKQLFGITCVCGLAFVLFLLVYDVPVRSSLKKMPYWEALGRKMKKEMKIL